MSIDHSDAKLDAAPAGAPAAALLRLAAERDAVLRGLVHALSNRVGTVSAVAGLLDPEAPAAGAAAGMLQGESERLERLLDELRLFAGEPTSEPEPLHLPGLVASAIALHAHHPTLRDVPCATSALRSLPPVLADPGEVLGVLLGALGAAKRGAGDAGVQVRGSVEGERACLVVERVDAPPPAAADDDVLEWALAHGAGQARLTRDGGALALRTLAAARR